MEDIKTSCEVHVELADIEEITGKDYLWLFDGLGVQFAFPFTIWCDEDEGTWFDWTDDEKWVAGWKELRNFFLEQCFQVGQTIWINIEE